VKTQEQFNKFSFHFILGSFTQIYRHVRVTVKTGQQKTPLSYMKTYMRSYASCEDISVAILRQINRPEFGQKNETRSINGIVFPKASAALDILTTIEFLCCVV
jgi:hypothetical protein